MHTNGAVVNPSFSLGSLESMSAEQGALNADSAKLPWYTELHGLLLRKLGSQERMLESLIVASPVCVGGWGE